MSPLERARLAWEFGKVADQLRYFDQDPTYQQIFSEDMSIELSGNRLIFDPEDDECV